MICQPSFKISEVKARGVRKGKGGKEEGRREEGGKWEGKRRKTGKKMLRRQTKVTLI